MRKEWAEYILFFTYFVNSLSSFLEDDQELQLKEAAFSLNHGK